MGLNLALSNAIGGLANVNAGLAVVSQNIANASTPDYAAETTTQQAVSADGIGMGVASGPAVRVLDAQQQASLFSQGGTVSGLQVRQQALATIDGVMGTPGQNTDLGSLLGQVQSAFSSLLADPSSGSQQRQVVAAAQGFTAQLNLVSNTVGQVREQAQVAIVAGVATLNATIAMIGSQTQQIMTARAAGTSSANLENQRDTALHTLSTLIDIRLLQQDNGNVMAITPSGLSINFQPGATQFTAQAANLGASSFYPGGGVPAITMNTVDVTAQLAGSGTLGGNIDVRDNIMPGLQAGLDEVAQTVSTRLQQQGLTLFSRADGTVPAGGGTPVQSTYVGYASAIVINPAIVKQPFLVRDGTNAVAGSATGASAFAPNPLGGPAGFTALISRVLGNSFTGQAQAGVAQQSPNTSGLGPQGNLVGAFSAGTLATITAAVASAQAQQSSAISTSLSSEKAVQASLQTRLSQASSVSVDAELSTMVQLQNAYGANARVMSAVQAMWTHLLATVP